MQYGNPVSIADGTKRQSETDLPAQTWHGLTFTRNSRSDFAGFATDYSDTGFNVGPGNVNSQSLCGMYFNGEIQTEQFGCASYFNMSTDGYVYRGSSNPYLQYWQPTGSSALVQGAGNLYQIVLRRADGSSIVRAPQNLLQSFASSGKLVSRTFADGFSQRMTYSDPSTPSSIAPWPGLLIGVTDTFGRSLQFQYDGNGYLSKMLDQAREPYFYISDSIGNITQVQYPDGTTRRYHYNEPSNIPSVSNPYALTGIYDENNVRYGNYGYDSTGAAIYTEHAGGQDHYTTSINNVTLPSGEQHAYQIGTFGAYTAPLSVTRSCPGCTTATTSYTLDTHGNAISIDDYNNHRTCYSHDVSRTLELVRVEGLSNTVTCSTLTAAGVALPAGARKNSTQWHPDWRLIAKNAAPGVITTLVYNGQPDPFNGNAIASCAPASALLPDGKPIAVPCKQVEQATTDVDGHLGFGAALQAGVANRIQQWTYNAVGQILSATDPLGHVTRYSYYSDTNASHTQGDLQTVTNALTQPTQYNTYNLYGQLLQSTDPNGVINTYSYDLRQHLKSVSVGGQTTRYNYWPTGLLNQVLLPDASYVSYSYDDAHRLTDVTDSLGNSIHYTLDNSGNRTNEAVKDPSGSLKRQLGRIVDALNRVQQTSGRE